MSKEIIHIEVIEEGKPTFLTTLEQFIADNTTNGECKLESSDVINLNTLKIGDSIQVGLFQKVKRVEAPLPALVALYADTGLSTLKDASAFQVLVNQPPKKEWCKVHPYIKDKDAKGNDIPFLYIPIERIEWLLSNVVINYRVEVKTIQQIANSVCVSVRLHYFNPVANEWTYHDGIGAAPLQTDKGASAVEWEKIKSNAVQIGAPAAKTYAVKDAAEQIGKLFGKDLNRREVVNYDYQKMVLDKYENALKND